MIWLAVLGLVLILIAIVLDFVGTSRINTQHYKDAKAAIYSAAILSIIGLIGVGVGLAMMSTANKAIEAVQANPDLAKALMAAA